MQVAYEQLVEPDDAVRRVGALSPKTVIVDVEPLVARWDTDQDSLVNGVAMMLDQFAANTVGVQVIAFATNSRRQLPVAPTLPGRRVLYEASAAKPLRLVLYRHLPRPGVVIGDQIATDGVLPWRLGYSFLHFRHQRTGIPRGPRIMALIGRPLLPLLFVQSVSDELPKPQRERLGHIDTPACTPRRTYAIDGTGTRSARTAAGACGLRASDLGCR